MRSAVPRQIAILGLTYSLLATFSTFLSAAEQPTGEMVPVDLGTVANQAIVESLLVKDATGNSLAELPLGRQDIQGVTFNVEPKIVQLGSSFLTEKPLLVTGIKVDAMYTKLHFLQACGFGRGTGTEDYYVKDGTQIGELTIRYGDGSQEVLPLVYGENVRDWWKTDEGVNNQPIKGAQVAWTGSNDLAKRLNASLRLYLLSWQNPHPEKTIATLDYASTGETYAAPFCVAITGERAK